MIGENIELTLLEIRGNKARLGIVAPAEVKVMRQELLKEPIKPATETNA